MVEWKRVIGILGGLGPHAHVELERRLLVEAERLGEGAVRDQDYPPWIVASIPQTPDRTEALLEGGPSPLPALERAARILGAGGGGSGTTGADFAVIACNTAHAFLDELRRRVSLPFLDVVGETARSCLERPNPPRVVGLLATTGTLRSGIYTRALQRLGAPIALVSLLDVPSGERAQEELVTASIYAIKSGAFRDTATSQRIAARLGEAVRALAAAGAELVVTACTEIPLVLGRDPVESTPLVDPLEVAAKACLEVARGERPLP